MRDVVPVQMANHGCGERDMLDPGVARSDVFDYIKRFHNPIIQRRLDACDHAFRLLTP